MEVGWKGCAEVGGEDLTQENRETGSGGRGDLGAPDLCASKSRPAHLDGSFSSVLAVLVFAAPGISGHFLLGFFFFISASSGKLYFDFGFCTSIFLCVVLCVGFWKIILFGGREQVTGGQYGKGLH